MMHILNQLIADIALCIFVTTVCGKILKSKQTALDVKSQGVDILGDAGMNDGSNRGCDPKK